VIWMLRAIRSFEAAFRAIARHRTPVAISIGCTVLAIRAALLPAWKIPTPSVPDEFSYLLLADTFASGRVTNPSHSMWQHFETPYVLHQPTYTSAYAPAQGLILAAGKVLTGRSWWGVWFSVGVMCTVLCWMLQQWLPPGWAMAGAVWAALQLGLTSYWINSYWGGAAAATGGGLILGAAARLSRAVTATNCGVMAIGLALLAASRPYEGGILGTCVIACLIWDLLRRHRASPIRIRTVLPGLGILLICGAALSYYCWRITGSPVKLPQYAYMQQYAFTKAFLWQKAPPAPMFRDPIFREEMGYFLIEQRQFDSFVTACRYTTYKAMAIGTFYLGPLMLVPLIMVPWLIRGRLRKMALVGAATMLAVFLTVPFELHYAAPLAGLFYLLALQALRILWLSRRYGNWIGKVLLPTAPAVCLVTILQMASPPSARPAHLARAALLDSLRRSQDRHVIIVQYGSPHRLADEWVYNDADIDKSPVVWARDMGVQNQELSRYFNDRKIWLLAADSIPLKLVPYASYGMTTRGQ
jgi:hypothetical protein